jgi:hypothetical protein
MTMHRQAAPHPPPTPLYVEFELAYVLARSQAQQPRPDQRLNAVETTLRRLAKPWRTAVPISPAYDLRMSDETREALMAWVEADDVAEGATLERLAVYASGAVTDPAVPAGWIRLRLRSAA